MYHPLIYSFLQCPLKLSLFWDVKCTKDNLGLYYSSKMTKWKLTLVNTETSVIRYVVFQQREVHSLDWPDVVVIQSCQQLISLRKGDLWYQALTECGWGRDVVKITNLTPNCSPDVYPHPHPFKNLEIIRRFPIWLPQITPPPPELDFLMETFVINCRYGYLKSPPPPANWTFSWKI